MDAGNTEIAENCRRLIRELREGEKGVNCTEVKQLFRVVFFTKNPELYVDYLIEISKILVTNYPCKKVARSLMKAIVYASQVSENHMKSVARLMQTVFVSITPSDDKLQKTMIRNFMPAINEIVITPHMTPSVRLHIMCHLVWAVKPALVVSENEKNMAGVLFMDLVNCLRQCNKTTSLSFQRLSLFQGVITVMTQMIIQMSGFRILKDIFNVIICRCSAELKWVAWCGIGRGFLLSFKGKKRGWLLSEEERFFLSLMRMSTNLDTETNKMPVQIRRTIEKFKRYLKIIYCSSKNKRIPCQDDLFKSTMCISLGCNLDVSNNLILSTIPTCSPTFAPVPVLAAAVAPEFMAIFAPAYISSFCPTSLGLSLLSASNPAPASTTASGIPSPPPPPIIRTPVVTRSPVLQPAAILTQEGAILPGVVQHVPVVITGPALVPGPGYGHTSTSISSSHALTSVTTSTLPMCASAAASKPIFSFGSSDMYSPTSPFEPFNTSTPSSAHAASFASTSAVAYGPSFMPPSLPARPPPFVPKSLHAHATSNASTSKAAYGPSVMPTPFSACPPRFAPTSSCAHTTSMAPTSTTAYGSSVMPKSLPAHATSMAPTSTTAYGSSFMPKSLPARAPSMAPTSSSARTPLIAPKSYPIHATSMAPTSTTAYGSSVMPKSLPARAPSMAPTSSSARTPLIAPKSYPIHATSMAPTSTTAYGSSFMPKSLPARAPSMAPTSSSARTPLIAPKSYPIHATSMAPTSTTAYRSSVMPKSLPARAPSMAPTSTSMMKADAVSSNRVAAMSGVTDPVEYLLVKQEIKEEEEEEVILLKHTGRAAPFVPKKLGYVMCTFGEQTSPCSSSTQNFHMIDPNDLKSEVDDDEMYEGDDDINEFLFKSRSAQDKNFDKV